MTLLATLASVFGIINGFANFPQIYKIFKTKSAKDIAVSTYLILIAGSIVWILYGIEILNIPILIMDSLALLEFIAILIGCYLYGGIRKSKKA
ncbi:MAG: SemiSWEET family transporter [Candidatus Gracilibacteria bacterium]|jgi:MtN3 and saliva related transmembrane protein